MPVVRLDDPKKALLVAEGGKPGIGNGMTSKFRQRSTVTSDPLLFQVCVTPYSSVYYAACDEDAWRTWRRTRVAFRTENYC